jgi:hypothetical protein
MQAEIRTLWRPPSGERRSRLSLEFGVLPRTAVSPSPTQSGWTLVARAFGRQDRLWAGLSCLSEHGRPASRTCGKNIGPKGRCRRPVGPRHAERPPNVALKASDEGLCHFAETPRR